MESSILANTNRLYDVDKSMASGVGLEVDVNNSDLKIVASLSSTLQSAQNRILAKRGSWVFDSNYGSTLFETLKKGAKVTSQEMFEIVSQALEPMVRDGRISSVKSVKVISSSSDSIYFQVTLLLGNTAVTQDYNVTN